jgi:hypothetical protein
MRLRGLLILLMLVPAFAFAQGAYDLVAPNGVVHVDESFVDGHKQLHCVVTSNEGDAELTYDGRSIQFGDGYAIEFTTLARTPASFVVRLVAVAPHGPSSTAIVARSLLTGETTHAGFDAFSVAMRRSRQAQIAGQVLGALPTVPAEGRKLQLDSHSRPPFTVAPTDCLTDVIGMVIAATQVYIQCGAEIPDISCLYAVMAFAGASYAVWNDCTGSYLDNSIGFGP